jgi:hypothetical protein
LRDDRSVRRSSLSVLVALAVLVAGCGGNSRPSAAQSAPPSAAQSAPPSAAQVVSGSCTASSAASSSGYPALGLNSSCVLVLGDGRRFRCPIDPPNATAASLAHTKGCAQMAPLVLSAAMHAVIARIDGSRSCLAARGQRVTGGPVLPQVPDGSSSPDGELIVGTARGALIAFYTSHARAARHEPAVARNARALGGTVEQHGSVSVLWVRQPSAARRTAVGQCTAGA